MLVFEREDKWTREAEYIWGREKGISRSQRYMTGVRRLNLSPRSLEGGFRLSLPLSVCLSLFLFPASLHMAPV